MDSESSNNDEDYIQESEDDSETIDSELEDVSDEDVEARTIGNWTYVVDPFSDSRGTELKKFENEFDIHPAVDLAEMVSPLKCFELFFSNVIHHLCEWTNERANQYFEETNYRSLKVRGLTWREVTIPEMYTFFAYMFLMGLVHLPEMSDYWSSSNLCSGPKCFDGKIMSRNRFQSILKFLRFSSPQAARKGYPVTRFAQYLAILRECCQLILDPGEHIAVDECLMLYKGRLHFRQFIKDKRSRFGLKLFCLCPSDPKFQGYTWNFSLYIGKDIYEMPLLSDSSDLPVSERIVLYLVQDLLNEGRHIVVDNWYLSVRLCEYLLKHNTYVTGTIRTNRGVPKQLVEEPLAKGTSLFLRNGDNLLVRFSDKREVYVLTSRYDAGLCEKVRVCSGGRKEFLYKPLHIEKYNMMMGSVDHVDQLLQPYNPTLKSYTWFKKFGIHMASRMLLNGLVIHRNAGGEYVRFKDFIIKCCEEIFIKYTDGYKKMFSAGGSKGNETKTLHQLVQIPNTDRKKRPQKRCRICTTKHVRKDTRLMCSGCEDFPGLCSKSHFDEYHKSLE